MNPAFHADTPPPPPPKPGSHETSRRGTPQVNAPSPATPQLQQQYRPDVRNQHLPQNTSNAHHAATQRPPTIEEGWLPDGIKEKSYLPLSHSIAAPSWSSTNTKARTTDLQTILQTPSLISALSATHPSHSAHQESLQKLLDYNKDLATHLLDLQSQLTTLRTSTESLLLQNQSLEVSWRKKQTEMDAALAPWSPKALYQRLSAGIAEQEAVCAAVEESFLEEEHLDHGKASEKEVAEWVRRVRGEGAKLAGRREAKARWDEGRVGGWR
ncbi:hypothetical protein BJY04DRAFT_220073 [Aspergillus karnatakaensis]|uniref:vacuolar protein sorting family 37 protein n=1 Tax=Aspergillus karnatakaensis TaxID=1810916 RepID=UPI003CCDFD18